MSVVTPEFNSPTPVDMKAGDKVTIKFNAVGWTDVGIYVRAGTIETGNVVLSDGVTLRTVSPKAGHFYTTKKQVEMVCTSAVGPIHIVLKRPNQATAKKLASHQTPVK
jgi:hypothetical protein